MPLPTFPEPAREYGRRQRAEVGAVLAAVGRQWSRMRPADLDASWSIVSPQLRRIMARGQQQVAIRPEPYYEAIVSATSSAAAATPVARVNPTSLVGLAGDGRPVDTLLDLAPIQVKELIAAGTSPLEALDEVGTWLDAATTTTIADTARHSESLSMGVRPRVTGYVRMIEPGACSRCAIMAGAYYRKNDGFERHPRCRCVHIPFAEAGEANTLLNATDYFESLSEAEQDRIFTKAGAEAIRAGADPAQVVNARRGMQTAQIGGRDVVITTEGTTTRGLAFDSLSTRGTSTQVEGLATRHTRGGPELREVRTTRAARPRLMPETIAQVATDPDDYLRLLGANGYLL